MSYHFRPRKRRVDYNETIKRGREPRTKPVVLCKMKRPGINSVKEYHEEWLKCVHKARPIKADHCDNQYALPVEFYGARHRGNVYDEKIETLLDVGIEPVFLHCNDVHSKYPDFSNWWNATTDPPDHTVRVGVFVHVVRLAKYIEILDALPAHRCRIYNNFEDVIIGSGKEIAMNSRAAATRYKSQEIYYVKNNDELLEFDSIGDCRADFIDRQARGEFAQILKSGIFDRLRVGRKAMTARPVWLNMNASTWDYHVKPLLDEKHVVCSTKNGRIKWTLDRSQVHGNVFDVETKSDKYWIYFMDKVEFVYVPSKQNKTMRISGYFLRENRRTGNIDGADLVAPAEQ